MTVFATSSAFFPRVSLSIIRNLVLRSMIVRMKSFPFCMRSISKCPNSSLFSTNPSGLDLYTLLYSGRNICTYYNTAPSSRPPHNAPTDGKYKEAYNHHLMRVL